VAQACRDRGIKTMAVSAGYISPEPRAEFFRHMDAANIDLKGFTEGFYKNLCSGKLALVLETLEYLKHETNVWFDITTVLIPGENDSAAEIEAESAWVMDRLGPDVPLHLTAFHPDWKLTDTPPTPPQTLRVARRIAMDAGIRYVYTGNIYDPAGQTIHCHACGSVLVGQDGYDITAWNLSADGGCTKCGARCKGVFEALAGRWGRRYQVVRPRACGAGTGSNWATCSWFLILLATTFSFRWVYALAFTKDVFRAFQACCVWPCPNQIIERIASRILDQTCRRDVAEGLPQPGAVPFQQARPCVA
jgi:pyruvate formate lyase activating enzyme